MVICGTGHRPDKLGGYELAAKARLVNLAEYWLMNTRTDVVITGMALGWDQALAEAAFNLGIPFRAYIPFEGQESKWPTSSQTYYRFLMTHAESVKECSEPGYAVWKMQHINQCMVDDADVVLALWNGSEGGTKNCIDYAKKIKKQIVNMWPVYDMIRAVNEQA